MAPRSSFLDFYEGGWQELFPSIGDDCEYSGAPLGTHGEVCLLPWEYRIERDDPEEIGVRFRVRTVRTPYLLEKNLTLKSEDPTLYIEERVTNEGVENLQFMWGHHPAFGPLFLDESCQIEVPLPCSARTVPYELGEHWVLPKDKEFDWPKIKGLDDKIWDVSKVLPPESKTYFIVLPEQYAGGPIHTQEQPQGDPVHSQVGSEDLPNPLGMGALRWSHGLPVVRAKLQPCPRTLVRSAA